MCTRRLAPIAAADASAAVVVATAAARRHRSCCAARGSKPTEPLGSSGGGANDDNPLLPLLANWVALAERRPLRSTPAAACHAAPKASDAVPARGTPRPCRHPSQDQSGVGPVRHLAGVAPGQCGDGLVWRLVFSFSQVEILENTICVKNVSITIVLLSLLYTIIHNHRIFHICLVV